MIFLFCAQIVSKTLSFIPQGFDTICAQKNKIVSKPHVLYYILKIISLKLSHPTFTCRYTVAWAAVVHVSCRSQVFDWYICICIIMTLCQLIDI